MSESEPNIRSFLAVEFESVFLSRLAACQKRLTNELSIPLRMTKRQQIHLTLMFLGDRTNRDLEHITQALSGIQHEPLSLACTGYDLFEPSVIYAKIEGANSLVKAIDETLFPLNIHREHREFIGHATLARTKEESTASVRRVLASLPLFHELSTVNRFTLFQSKISHLGAEYSVLKRFSLG